MVNLVNKIIIFLTIFFLWKHKLFIDDLANYPHSKNDCYPKLWNNNLDKNIYDLYEVGIPNFC